MMKKTGALQSTASGHCLSLKAPFLSVTNTVPHCFFPYLLRISIKLFFHLQLLYDVSLLISTCLRCISSGINLYEVYLFWYLPIWGVSLLVSTWMCVSLLISTWVRCISPDIYRSVVYVSCYLPESSVSPLVSIPRCGKSLLISTCMRCISSGINLNVCISPGIYLSGVYTIWYVSTWELCISPSIYLSEVYLFWYLSECGVSPQIPECGVSFLVSAFHLLGLFLEASPQLFNLLRLLQLGIPVDKTLQTKAKIKCSLKCRAYFIHI